jgi:zinc transport system substrate-binding protein
MSEHRATFTAAQVAGLGKADLVFIIGHGLEAKLAQLSGSAAVNGKKFVELSEAPGIGTYPIREGGAWEHHEHEHEPEHAEGEESHDRDHTGEAGHDEHAEGLLTFDPHVWLDPENAKAMASHVAAELARADPANASAYATNAAAFSASIDKTVASIATELAPVKSRNFIVFHDAYQYFEKRFGLSAAGSISDISAKAPSAQRLQEVRKKLADSQAVCVFREPQYDSKLVSAVIEGSKAREGVLDPLGAALVPGPNAYQRLLANLAGNLKACLAG